MRRLIARPATVIVSEPSGAESMTVCMAAYLSNEHGVESTVEMESLEEIFMVDVGTIDVQEPGILQGSTAPNGYGLVVRATIPEDAVALPSLPAYPLPVPVLIATIAGENMDTHVEALVEDDGYVSTLLLVTDMGLYTRYSRTWIKLRDIDVIDGMNSIEVQDGAVDVYDTADDLGQQVAFEALPSESRDTIGTGQLFVSASSPVTFSTEEEAVTASAANLPIIDTPEQLTAALEAATSDESLRWYVERRAAALGVEVSLPWA